MPLLVFHGFVVDFMGNTHSVCVTRGREKVKTKCEVLSFFFQDQKDQIRQHSACKHISAKSCVENRTLTSQGGRTAPLCGFPKVRTITFTFTLTVPPPESRVHSVWTSYSSPRLPRIKDNCTLRVTGLLMQGSCHVGFLFSFWFILRAPNISQWWSRTPG